MLNYIAGDNLLLLQDAINTETGEIIFPKDTEVIITKIEKGIIYMKFPDNIVYAHNGIDVPSIFKHKNEGKLLTNHKSGVGTPPKALFPYLPDGADWKKNYVWKMYITLEERENKKIICPECTTEIKNVSDVKETGKYYCNQCKFDVVAFNLETNAPAFNVDKI